MTFSLPEGFQLYSYDTLGSTNDEAKRLAGQGAEHGVVVWAKEQTAGRGRSDRIWSSPPGNLYFSILVRPSNPIASWGQLSFVAAVALGEVLLPLLPPSSVTFKWPNDVLINKKKTSGVLLEAQFSGGQEGKGYVIIGIGLNCAHYPAEAMYPATSLLAEGVNEADMGLEALLSQLIYSFASHYQSWTFQGFQGIRDAWLRHAQGIGEQIKVRLPNKEVTGVFRALSDEGELILESENGSKRMIAAGDVFFG